MSTGRIEVGIWLVPARREDRRMERELAKAAQARARTETRYAVAVARREHRLAKARRSVPVSLAVAATGAGLAVFDFGPEPVMWAGAVVFALRASRAAAVLGTPPVPAPAPVAAGPAPAPGRRSAARPYVERLDQAHLDLRRLLPLVGAGGREVAQQAWDAAAAADHALRWQAARLAGVEPHRGVDPELLDPLEEGVGDQERLVLAVADLVSASADPGRAVAEPGSPAPGRLGVGAGVSRLREAADAVLGLAAGLREVR